MNTLANKTDLNGEVDHNLLQRLTALQQLAVSIAGLMAVVVLLGWINADIARLMPSGWDLMKSNTALSILLSAVALVLIDSTSSQYQRLLGNVLALCVLLLAGAALLGHLTETTFWLETFISLDSYAELPGRMSVHTASFFILFAISVLLVAPWAKFATHIADSLNMLLLIFVLVILAGYYFGAVNLFGISMETRTSPHTLVAMILLVFSLFISRTKHGFFSLLVINGMGSHIARMAIPFVLPLPFFIVSGSAALITFDWLSPPYAAALTAAITATLLLFLIIHMAQKINRVMQTLSVSEAQTKQLLNAVGEGIYGLDLEGNITFSNPAACELLDYTPEALHQKSIFDLVYHPPAENPEPKKKSCTLLLSIADGKTHKVDNIFFVDRNGRQFPVEYTSTPLCDEDNVTGAVIVFKDITERKQVERLKDEFISTVSHELRTPLTSIKGSLGLVLNGNLGDLSDKTRAMLQIAYNNSDRLNLLINDLLDINKIQSGALRFTMAPIDVNALISKAVAENQGYADQYKVHIDWEPNKYDENTENDQTQIWGDEHRLQQVLANLLSNAIKFSPPEGHVILSIKPDHEMMHILVTDTGSGIPTEFQDKVFEKFTQADSSNTRQLGGTGLGLAISKEIVERHNGKIGFNSTPEKGTTFYIELPKAKQGS